MTREEDKVLLTRMFAGLAYGVISVIIAYLQGPQYSSTITWSLSPIVYYLTIVYVVYKFRPRSRFVAYFKGLLTFYLAFLFSSIAIYDLIEHFL